MQKDSLILTRAESRELDRRAMEKLGIPSIVLMENAGRSVVDYLLTQYPKGPILICCGKGNNGGDGFVVARHLDNHGMPVQVLLCADPGKLEGDAKTNFNIIKKSGLHIILLHEFTDLDKSLHNLMSQAEWIIDALFGTGFNGKVKAPFDKIMMAMNDSASHILSIDVPSGLDCDTGETLGVTVKAEHTVTFFGMKKGFISPLAKEFIGHVHIADIGIPMSLIKQH